MHTARELTEDLVVLLRREHEAMADFLVALSDFDRRRLWSELGYASLFQFLNRELRLSLGAAQYRKAAAELIQHVPAVVQPLRDGRLCFSSIIEAAKVVTAGNWESVLPRFYGLSKREAMEVVAELQPHPAPPSRTVVTAVRPAASFSASALAPVLEERADRGPATGPISLDEVISVTPAPQLAPPGPQLVPLTAQLRRMHVTVSKAFADKLQAAADARPDLTMEQILEAGVDLLLEKSAKAKGLVDRPQKKIRSSKDEGRVPAHVKREVMNRDGGRCQFRLASGERCGSTHGLQLDHVVPRGRGGKSTVDNLRILCSAHNDLAARQEYGDVLMDRYTGRERRGRGS